MSAAQIAQRGLDDPASSCRATLDQFCVFLGTVAADLALTSWLA